MNPLFCLIPGVGPFLGAAWTFIASPIGARSLIVGAGAFGGGYALKARLDRSATLQAVIAKQRIDLEAATRYRRASGRDGRLRSQKPTQKTRRPSVNCRTVSTQLPKSRGLRS